MSSLNTGNPVDQIVYSTFEGTKFINHIAWYMEQDDFKSPELKLKEAFKKVVKSMVGRMGNFEKPFDMWIELAYNESEERLKDAFSFYFKKKG